MWLQIIFFAISEIVIYCFVKSFSEYRNAVTFKINKPVDTLKLAKKHIVFLAESN